MRFDIVTLFPGMIADAAAIGVTGRALSRGQVQLQTWNPRDYARDRYRRVDDRPYGGGPGMVMSYQPLRDALQAARRDHPAPGRSVYLSPQGRPLDQQAMLAFSRLPRLILVAGRYEGVDERLIELEIDEEWSIGDYVLSGGELAALVVFDAVVRLLPGVLGHEASAAQDSHMVGWLDCPHYTRPEVVEGRAVPPILLSGDHAAIQRWRQRQSLRRTRERRPDLFERLVRDPAHAELLATLEQDTDL